MDKGVAYVGMLLSLVAGMAAMNGILGERPSHGDIQAAAESGTVSVNHASAKVPVTADDPSWGSANAPVTVVLFSDYQCPFCTRVEPTMEALKRKYGPKKLRVVWKHFPLPFHKKAVPAHVAAQTVFKLGGNDAFWKFHALVFKNQRNLSPSNFEGWAAAAGVDKAKFKAMFSANSQKAKIDADLRAGKAAGVRGTPASFVNGVFLSGARPQQAFAAEIDKQLKAAQRLIDSGVGAEKIYPTLTNRNHNQKAKPSSKKAKKRPPADTKTVWKVPVYDTDPVKGPADAAITIVEFSEFQCPFCSRVLPTMKKIMETYKGKVRIVFKDQPLPFHKRALPASIFAREARAQKGMKGFWDAHDLLFQNQRKLEDEQLMGYGKQLGLDAGKLKAALEKQPYKGEISKNQELAAEVKASGTPHFFINGRRLVGAQPFAKFKEIIDQEITKTAAMLKKGVKADELYNEIMKTGKAPPPPERKDVGAAPSDAPFKGGATAKVVIQEFSDFQCPFCGRVNGSIKQLLAAYGDKVKVVWRHKPLAFHKDAPMAHQAAHEAFIQKGNKGFWDYHDKLFAGQRSPGLKREALEKYAQELGLDMSKFKKALDDQTHKDRVERDNAASNKAGIRGTPAFTINGYFLSGAQPFAKFKKLVELAMKQGGGNAKPAKAPKGSIKRVPAK